MPTCTVTGTPEPNTGRQHADVLVRKGAVENGPAKNFTKSQAGRLANDVIHLAGFLPESELACADVPRHAFRRSADQCKLPIVDRPGSVHGNMVDQASFHQINDESCDACLQHMSSHEKNACSAMAFGRRKPAGKLRQGGMAKVGQGRIQGQHVTQIEIVLTTGKLGFADGNGQRWGRALDCS